MKELTFKYRPFRWLPFKKVVKTQHPTDWAELTPLQFVELSKVLQLDEITQAEQEYISNVLLGRKKIFVNIPSDIFELSRFALKTPKPLVYIKKIYAPKKTLIAPADGFYNMTTAEFIHADTYFKAYNDNQQAEHLNKLIACLYRKQADNLTGEEEDRREPFKEKTINPRAKSISKIAPEVKEAILFNYRIIRFWIEEKYPYVFGKAGSSDELLSIGGTTSSWVDIFRSVVGDDIANEEKYAESNVHTFLSKINSNIKNSQKK